MADRVLVPMKADADSASARHRLHRVTTPDSWMTHVDGLRGLAILLVVVFHVFVGKVSSGVDVFLFLGGMFLLGSQMSNVFRDDGMSLVQVVIRLIRRLYPAFILVISVIGVAGMFVYPVSLWGSHFRDMAASALYIVNFDQAAQGNSYAAIGRDPSAFQHLWSMSAQIHIYIAIILIVMSLGTIQKYTGGKQNTYKRIIVSVITLTTLLSFGYAWWLSGVNQSMNYYSSFSRFWEIGAGALFGYLLLKRMIFAPYIRWAASTIGLLLILFTGVFLNGAQQFPGPYALIPLFGAALVVMSGRINKGEDRNFSSLGPVWLLNTGVMRTLGSISYSLYLWHWGILVLVAHLYGGSIPWWMGVLVIAVSLVLAWLTRKYVEEPLRQKSKPSRKSLFTMLSRENMIRNYHESPSVFHPVAVLASVVAVMVILAAQPIYQTSMDVKAREVAAEIEKRGGVDHLYPGASAYLAGAEVEDDLPIFPDPGNIDVMFPPTLPNECYSDFEDTDLPLNGIDGEPCVFGNTEADDVLYLIGGSHSEHFLPALMEIGEKRGFAVRPLVKLGCAPYHEVKYDDSEYVECPQWTDTMIDYVLENPPSMGIFMTGSRPTDISGAGPEIVPDSYVDVVKRFSDAGIHSWLIRDNPWGITAPDSREQQDFRMCVADNQENPDECSQPWDWTMAPEDPQQVAYRGIDNVTIMDATPAYTRNGQISPVVGGVLVYRDSHHFTSQFVMTMVSYLDVLMYPVPESR